jgi:hypothetical protein
VLTVHVVLEYDELAVVAYMQLATEELLRLKLSERERVAAEEAGIVLLPNVKLKT